MRAYFPRTIHPGVIMGWRRRSRNVIGTFTSSCLSVEVRQTVPLVVSRTRQEIPFHTPGGKVRWSVQSSGFSSLLMHWAVRIISVIHSIAFHGSSISRWSCACALISNVWTLLCCTHTFWKLRHWVQAASRLCTELLVSIELSFTLVRKSPSLPTRY